MKLPLTIMENILNKFPTYETIDEERSSIQNDSLLFIILNIIYWGGGEGKEDINNDRRIEMDFLNGGREN